MNDVICETCIHFDEDKKSCDTGRIKPDNMYDCGEYYRKYRVMGLDEHNN